MKESDEYVLKIFNKEITKLRHEIYLRLYEGLCKTYEEKFVKMSWQYFMAIPIMDSLNRPSLLELEECCKAAKSYYDEKTI